MNVLLKKYILEYLEVKGIISANLQIVLEESERREEEGGREREELGGYDKSKCSGGEKRKKEKKSKCIKILKTGEPRGRTLKSPCNILKTSLSVTFFSIY